VIVLGLIFSERIVWDVSGFVRLFLILTKNKFLTSNLREIDEKHGILG